MQLPNLPQTIEDFYSDYAHYGNNMSYVDGRQQPPDVGAVYYIIYTRYAMWPDSPELTRGILYCVQGPSQQTNADFYRKMVMGEVVNLSLETWSQLFHRLRTAACNHKHRFCVWRPGCK